MTVRQNFRFSKKLSLSHQLGFGPKFNNIGYTSSVNGTEVIFARRKVNSIENILSAKYNFSNKMGLNFRMRHYFSSIDNKEFYTLNKFGKLDPIFNFTQDMNQNIIFFTIDMVYTWEFAPGSFFNVVWKNAVFDSKKNIEKNYFKNFSHTIESDQNNNISLKVIYFLDYLQLKKHKKKN